MDCPVSTDDSPLRTEGRLCRQSHVRFFVRCLAILLLGGLTGWLRPTSAMAEEQPTAVFGPEVERLIPGLIRPASIGGALVPGVQLSAVAIQPTSIRLEVRGAGESAALVLSLRGKTGLPSGGETASFQVRLEPDPPPAGLAAALDTLRSHVAHNDTGALRGAAQDRPPPASVSTWPVTYRRDSVFQVPAGGLLQLRLAQAMLLTGLFLVWWRRRALWLLASRVTATEWAALAGCLGVGLALRLVGGIRVPGYNNNHGFNLVWSLLQEPNNAMTRPYGFGPDALHGLAFLLLPRGETSIVVVQCLCSLGTVVATWAIARVYLGRKAALWSALLLSVLSGSVYYALTEVPHVPGAFFLSVSLWLAGLGVQQRDLVLLLAAGLLGAFAAQFHPTLLATPAVVGLFVLGLVPPAQLVRRPSTWLTVALVAALLWPNVHSALVSVRSGQGPAASMLPTPLGLLQSLAWHTAFDEGGNRFLNTAFTPPLFGALALVGVVAGVRQRAQRLATLACLAAALVFSSVQLNTAQMDALRHQLTAQGFWALLAGVGTAQVVAWAGRSGVARAPLWRASAMAGLIGLSLALWPGPLGQHFTPQDERQVYLEGVTKLPDQCTIAILDANQPFVSFSHLPVYLSVAVRRQHLVGLFSNPSDLLAQPAGCLVYYRPAGCWNAEAMRNTTPPPDPKSMLPVCQAFEAGLQLEPFHLRTLPDRPDAFRRLMPDRMISFGFFWVRRGDRRQ